MPLLLHLHDWKYLVFTSASLLIKVLIYNWKQLFNLFQLFEIRTFAIKFIATRRMWSCWKEERNEQHLFTLCWTLTFNFYLETRVEVTITKWGENIHRFGRGFLYLLMVINYLILITELSSFVMLTAWRPFDDWLRRKSLTCAVQPTSLGWLGWSLPRCIELGA